MTYHQLLCSVTTFAEITKKILYFKRLLLDILVTGVNQLLLEKLLCNF